MYCPKCGTELPDGAAFCYKCGASVSQAGAGQQAAQPQQPGARVIAPAGTTVLKCPSCGAPISPKFGEMVITCEYCGASVTLGNEGWKDIQKHTMLPLRFTKDQVTATIHDIMDKGVFRHHLQEESTLEEMNATFIPYWIVPVSARTTVVAVDEVQQLGQAATTAALMGIVLGGMGGGFGGRRSFETAGLLGAGGSSLLSRLGRGALGLGLPRTMMFGMGMGMGGGATKTYQLDQSYNFPVVAMHDLTEYQPRDYTFALSQRVLFDVSKIDKGIKVLNGDISEDVAKAQAKTLVDQLQSQKAHQQHRMIQQIRTDMDVSDGELLHVPVWFARYDHKGKKYIFVLDGNSGAPINSIGA
ncbi:MAG: zinc ribbon domain-containing protein [Nitrososphaerota archaeon]|nr:zinc ribbon domain-containing protein [Nitrososphaerota archaeon]MDG7005678.1 zinc ribbon domain-containing protein [Nitrososphaerota archaeon]